MEQVLQYPAEFLVETVHNPSVCLVLPFEPQLNDKLTIINRLKNMLSKAEARLLQLYSTNKVLPLLAGIQQMMAGINFSNYKKSMAILASPYGTHLFYLDYPVAETIRAGESIGIREVVKARKSELHYLVLVLGDKYAQTYEGTCDHLTCIKENKETQENSLYEQGHFIKRMDQGLGILLETYALPVFVLGDPEVLSAFRHLTEHGDHIIDYLPGDLDKADTTLLVKALQPALSHWNKHKQWFILQKLHKASQSGKLARGIQNVWQTATHRRGAFLVIEEDLGAGLYKLDGKDASYPFVRPASAPVAMRDLVEDAIEKVLRDGGEVEFVERDTLKDFQHIALIEHHR